MAAKPKEIPQEENEFSTTVSSRSSRSRSTRKRDAQRFVDFISFPFYTALGLGDAIATAIDDAAMKARDRVKDRREALLNDDSESWDEKRDRLRSKAKEKKEKFADFFALDDDADSEDTKKTNIDDLFHDVVDSAGKLVQGFAQRGARLSVIKPSDVKSKIDDLVDDVDDLQEDLTDSSTKN